jgi:hypothetical protein
VWIGWTITAVLTGGAVATGILALQAKHDSDTKLGTIPGNAADISNAHRNTQIFAGLTDGLGAAAIIAGGLSLVFTLSSGKSEPSKGGTAGGIEVGVAPDRLILRGEF